MRELWRGASGCIHSCHPDGRKDEGVEGGKEIRGGVERTGKYEWRKRVEKKEWQREEVNEEIETGERGHATKSKARRG